MKVKTEKIYFYEPSEPNGWLANFSQHPIIIDGITYKTVEHFFQSQKFYDQIIFEKILNARTPGEAKKFAKENIKSRRRDWDNVKEQVMYEGIKAKFSQYNELKELLLSTGNKEIIENSNDDSFWGIGENNNGKNKMGFLLMKLRNTLITI